MPMIIPPLFALGEPWLINWLTPIWILSVGAALGLLVVAIAGAIYTALVRKGAASAWSIIREGVLWPIALATFALAIFSLPGWFVVQEPTDLLASAAREFFTGEEEQAITLAPGVQTVSLPAVQRDELSELKIYSARDLTITTVAPKEANPDQTFQVIGSEDPSEFYHYRSASQLESPFPQAIVDQLHVENRSTNPVAMQLTIITEPVHPEAGVIPYLALSVFGIFFFYFLQQRLMPKLSAISFAAAKTEMAQPLFVIMLSLISLLLIVFIYLPYNTFGEDIKVMKDTSLSIIMVGSIMLAVWMASNSITDELEGKTALTILSKPIGRWQFIVGKLLGILWTVTVFFVVLGLLCLICTAYKPIFDSRESTEPLPLWQRCFTEMIQIVPGLLLAFFEAVIMASISVALSTRLPMLANIVICISIYALGHITPLIALSTDKTFEPIQFVGTLLATVFPVLDHFNIQPAIASGVPVPLEYLFVAFLYCLLYSSIAMLLGLTLFEDRDLT